MLAIDANIFLEILLQQKLAEESAAFLVKVRDGSVHAMISDFNVSGIVLVMGRYGKDWRALRTFLVSLLAYKGLMVYQSTMADKIHATDLMRKHGLDFEDALTLQCAFANGCEMLVSFDKDFEKVGGIKRVSPAGILSNG